MRRTLPAQGLKLQMHGIAGRSDSKKPRQLLIYLSVQHPSETEQEDTRMAKKYCVIHKGSAWAPAFAGARASGRAG